jgi:DNA (cytosine-5)-methyltransferase 1
VKKITTVDLFCGAGGFTEGFSKAKGFEAILAIDSDKQAIDTFKHNHNDINAVCEDISNLNKSDLLTLTGNKKIDVVIGGPPCQGFSLAGRRLPDDPKNQLFKEYVRIVDILKPNIFIFENVVGITSMQGGLVLEAICEEFKKIGYEVSFDILNSAEFGVPQARPRFILIGAYNSKPVGTPLPTHGKNNNLDLFSNLKPQVTVKDALSNLPVIEQGQGGEEMRNVVPLNSYQKLLSGNRKNNSLYNHRATKLSNKIV